MSTRDAGDPDRDRTRVPGERVGVLASATRQSRIPELVVALAIPLLLFVVYVRSPTTGLWDAKFAALASEAILEGEGFDLSRFIPWMQPSAEEPESSAPRLPWQVMRSGERLLYFFPPGTPVLSVPLVLVMRAFGLSSLDEQGIHRTDLETRLQLHVASLLAALTALTIFRLARREVALLPAAAIALVAGLGSSLWTIASRALWSQTWSALLLGLGLLELLRWEDGERPRPVLLGAIASAAFWVRPTNAWIAVAWTVFVLVRHRAQAWKLIAAGALGLAGYFAWSFLCYGTALPNYVTMGRRWVRQPFWGELAESLVSTRHGLLLYSPILFAVIYLLLRHGVASTRKPLVLLATVVVTGHLALHAASGAKWGPDGPRLQHDAIPILAWLGAVSVRRKLERTAPSKPLVRQLGLAGAIVAASLASASLLASIGSLSLGNGSGRGYRERIEASYGHWDVRRLPQHLGLRALGVAEPLPPRKSSRRRARPGD